MTAARTLVEVLPPQPPLSLAEKNILSTYDAKVRSASATIKRSSCEIAYYGWRIKKADRWSEFNCATEEEYFTSRGINSHLWSTAMIVGRLLEPLSLEELTTIGIYKGKLLSNVHSDLWHDYPWLADAKRMSERDFRDIVALRNRSLDGGEASQALLNAESEYAKSITKDKINYLRRKYNLDNSADAVAIALREADSTVTLELAKAARHANKLLTLSKQALRQRRKSALSGSDKNIDRLITKAQNRLTDAITCAVQVQSRHD
jgi:hypothetical protein